ncbi:trichohyalin isoform X2 [Agrilus planipennis]|uniref:Trichohyalin isoform X2 n=1 Tax=Agrilus planipennis TaxID=224129 RepID=A0A1W4WCS8_AGRPL|nr:trichohyalin isoform X2 [Agrilus planipennis]
MSDFDDDLLDDLLSEGSSDSFFDDPKTKSKKDISKKNETEKSTVTKIFGLESKEAKKDLEWLNDTPAEKGTKKLDEAPLRRKPAKKVSFEDDILDALGLENATAPAPAEEIVKDATASFQKDPVKKKALLDDILGLKLQKSNPNPDEKKSTSISSKPSTATSTKSEEGPKDTTNVEFTLSNFARENRRSRTTPSYTRDPLGLLTTTGNVQEKERFSPVPKVNISFEVTSQGSDPKSSKRISWLDDGDNPVKTVKSTAALPTADMSKSASSLELFQSDRTSSVNEDNSRKEQEANRECEISDIFLQRVSAHGGNYSNISLAMQQQESLLVMALQMKKYEESLLGIQKKQEEIFNRQEEYFRRVVEEQLLKQHSIDSSLQIQQEKINKHIEALMFSTPHLGASNINTNEEKNEEVDREKDAVISLLKEKQHEEVFVLEESYKKQISLLEETMKSVEDRLRTEIIDNAKYYKEIIENLHQQHKADIEKYENKIKQLSDYHEKELQSLRESHNRIVEDIKNEYGEMLNNFKQSKQYEQQAFEGATTYIKKLDDSLGVLTSSTSNINDIKSKLNEECNILSKVKEESIKAKEKEIEMMRETLEKARESNDNERSQLMALVRNLELKLVEQSQNSREDRWAFQQATSSLVAKMAAADREAEFQRAAIEREREQLKTLKENLLAEQEKLVLQLTEEKLAISAEKSRLEISSKLANNYDVQKAQVEVEAAVKAARDAAAKTDLERENLLKAQHELESLKRDMRDRDHVLSLKEKSFEALQKELDDRAAEAERALAQAKLIETTYANRTRDMHKQVAVLAQREKKLAEEKLNLSKERLALQMDLQQLRRCTLCASSVRVSSVGMVHEIGYDDYDVLDPDMARLRNEANDESIRSPLVEGRTED